MVLKSFWSQPEEFKSDMTHITSRKMVLRLSYKHVTVF